MTTATVNMPFATPIVPMPRWSTPVGCTKLFLTIVVLAFVAASTAVWGWYPAFGISIFSAVLSLVAFGYYLTALSFKPCLYNKWLVLGIETFLTLLWFVSLILLAGWTGASSAIPQYYYNIQSHPTLSGSTVNLSGRSLPCSWEPFGRCKRQGLVVPSTMVRTHGTTAHYAAQMLAGISAGLAGMIFIMYGATLAAFAMNFHETTLRTSAPPSRAVTPGDEESQVVTQAPTHTQFQRQIDTHTPGDLDIEAPHITASAEPEKQEHHSVPTPTPATEAEKMDKSPDQVLETFDEVDLKEPNTKTNRDVTRDDGRVEREV